jgi:hypothetical protein
MGNRRELARLCEKFPGWEFGTRWVAAGSGPDMRMYEARREGMTISAASAAELAAKILEHES